MIFYSSTEQNVPIRLAGIFLLLCWKPVPALLLPFIFLGGKLSFISCWRKWRPLFISSLNTGEWNTGGGLMPLKFLCPHAHISMSAPSPGGAGFPPGQQCPEGGKLGVNRWKRLHLQLKLKALLWGQGPAAFASKKSPDVFQFTQASSPKAG